MQQEVYGDLYFLINAGMDLLCVYITAALTHRKTSRLRAILSGTVGGLYALLALLLHFSGIFGILADLATGFLLCAIAFRHRGMKVASFGKLSAVFLLISALLGGFMTVLFSLLNRLSLPLGSLDGDGISAWLFAGLAFAASFFTLKGGKWLGLSGKTYSAAVTVTAFGKTLTLEGFFDSGNQLRDPVSGKNVIVAKAEKLRGFLPDVLLLPIGDNRFCQWLSREGNARLVRWIPTQTATGSGLLLAILPDRLILNTGDEEIPADYLLAVGNWNGSHDAVIPME